MCGTIALVCLIGSGPAEAKTRSCRGVNVVGIAKTKIRTSAPRRHPLACSRARRVMAAYVNVRLVKTWVCLQGRDQVSAGAKLFICRRRPRQKIILIAMQRNIFADYEASPDRLPDFDYERFLEDLQARRCQYSTADDPYPGMLAADASIWTLTTYRFGQVSEYGYTNWKDRDACSTEMAVYSTGPEPLPYRRILMDYADGVAAASRYYDVADRPVRYSEYAGWFNRLRDYVLCRMPGSKILTLEQFLKLNHVKPRVGGRTPPQDSSALECPTT